MNLLLISDNTCNSEALFITELFSDLVHVSRPLSNAVYGTRLLPFKLLFIVPFSQIVLIHVQYPYGLNVMTDTPSN